MESFYFFREVVEEDEEDEEEEDNDDQEAVDKTKQAVKLIKYEPFDHCVCCKLALCGPYKEKSPRYSFILIHPRGGPQNVIFKWKGLIWSKLRG